MEATKPLKIGILNLMADKIQTNRDFTEVFTNQEQPTELIFYYPQLHYQSRMVPQSVVENLQPLDLNEAAQLDAVIVTGAPIERLEFRKVTYYPEVAAFLEAVRSVSIKLFICWGAMAALHYYYGIDKQPLSQKLFGIYPQRTLQSSELLANLPAGFVAPHARYYEVNYDQVVANPELKVVAISSTNNLFLVQNQAATTSYLFAHLEYPVSGLNDEYLREITAHPEASHSRPVIPADFTESAWQKLQHQFFKNWLLTVAKQSALMEVK